MIFRGRGGSSGFYRGGRGRGVNQGYRGRGDGHRGRGGFQPGRPTGGKKETLKFEGEYDFDKANEEFKEVLEKLQVRCNENKDANSMISEKIFDRDSSCTRKPKYFWFESYANWRFCTICHGISKTLLAISPKYSF